MSTTQFITGTKTMESKKSMPMSEEPFLVRESVPSKRKKKNSSLLRLASKGRSQTNYHDYSIPNNKIPLREEGEN